MDQDKSIMENNEDSEVVNKPVEASAATDSNTKDLKVLLDGQSTKVVETIKKILEWILDGQTDSSTIPFDLTLSAVMSFDAYIYGRNQPGPFFTSIHVTYSLTLKGHKN